MTPAPTAPLLVPLASAPASTSTAAASLTAPPRPPIIIIVIVVVVIIAVIIIPNYSLIKQPSFADFASRNTFCRSSRGSNFHWLSQGESAKKSEYGQNNDGSFHVDDQTCFRIWKVEIVVVNWMGWWVGGCCCSRKQVFIHMIGRDRIVISEEHTSHYILHRIWFHYYLEMK